MPSSLTFPGPNPVSYEPVSCDVCGKFRTGTKTPCSRCGLMVCDRCWFGQRRVGHEMAEHGNEIRRDYYDDNPDDEDGY